jgi:hypothetical protein
MTGQTYAFLLAAWRIPDLKNLPDFVELGGGGGFCSWAAVGALVWRIEYCECLLVGDDKSHGGHRRPTVRCIFAVLFWLSDGKKEVFLKLRVNQRVSFSCWDEEGKRVR